MSADAVLSRLDRVRRVGDDRWVAACPSHADKSPSLSIRELEDGRVLVHDFGGCSVEQVLSAIGMELADLYPKRPNTDRAPRERKPWSDRQLLEIIDRETNVIFVAACDVTLAGRRLSDVDMSRLRKARERVTAVMGALA
ncbi:MAG TPA: hypothetical protein VLD36_10895 [Burkholderiales bacterium]|nr:hypothetical protein [Burkholderiales bacterium]